MAVTNDLSDFDVTARRGEHALTAPRPLDEQGVFVWLGAGAAGRFTTADPDAWR